MSKKIIVIVAVLLLAGFAFYKFYLYKPVRDVGSESASLTITAAQLAKDYQSNAVAADAKYLNKTIAVSGTVTNAADSLMTIDAVVVCGFDKLPAKKDIGKTVAVKGRCIGYDELFGEVKLDQCTIKE